MNDEGIKQDMPARVARWADLEGFTGGHPDSGHEGYARKLYSVIGLGRLTTRQAETRKVENTMFPRRQEA